jgi:hypothetical protein
MKNNERKETDMKGNPPGSTKPMDNFFVVTGCVSAGAEMKNKEMNGHPYYQQ